MAVDLPITFSPYFFIQQTCCEDIAIEAMYRGHMLDGWKDCPSSDGQGVTQTWRGGVARSAKRTACAAI